MKKRLFIACHYMEIGGAEISLIGLLQAFDYSKYNVDLFIYRHTGELMKFIPKEVNLLPEIKAYADIEKPLRGVLLSSSWKVGLVRLWSKWLFMRYQKKHPETGIDAYFGIVEPRLVWALPSLYKYGEYDAALNFIGNAGVITDKVKAKKRISWIHTDYSSISVIPEFCPMNQKIDYIASISKSSTEAYLKVFPERAEKMVDIENILSTSFVRQRSELEKVNLRKSDNEIILLSVGRFCEAKNYDNVPAICKLIADSLELRELGKFVKWYIIGYGSDEELIRQKINEAGMEDNVIILGKKDNPYPYINACDWYVQPSRYEGKSVTVREAQMLYKPVIIANYTTAKSQVQDGLDGVIVPQENKACAEAMAKTIINIELHQEIEKYLHEHDYGNVSEVQKIYDLIG